MSDLPDSRYRLLPEEDGLKAARGLRNALILSAILYAVMGVLIWVVAR